MRRAHAEEYNREIQREDVRRYRPWAALETLQLAKAEIAFDGYNINQHLARIFVDRTLDQIKSFRRGEEYKALRDRLRTEMEEAGDDESVEEPTEVSRRLSSTLLELEPSAAPASSEVYEYNPLDQLDNEREDLQSNVSISGPPPPSPDPSSPSGSFSSSSSLSGSVPSSPHPMDSVLLYVREILEHMALSPDRVDVVSGIIDDSATAETVQSGINEIWNWIVAGNPPSDHRNNNPRTLVAPQNRKQKYAHAQKLYDRDRSRLAEGILADTLYDNHAPSFSAEEAFETYNEILGTLSPPDDAPISDVVAHDVEVYRPILDGELRKYLNARQSMSKGLDNIRIVDLRSAPFSLLLLLFNLSLYTAKIPDSWRANRTVLIPKSGCDNADINTWRPITISSIGLRLFNKIMAARFSQLPLTVEQRGFRSIDGAYANTLSLQAVIKQCRADSQPFSVTTLDLRKAFDTVSHHSIMRALRRFNLHPKICALVGENYTGSTTVININGVETGNININRGVKQGDPLSPLLFNMVMDEAIATLKRSGAGINIGAGRLTCLAYADDLLVFTESRHEMQLAVRLLEKQVEKRGMHFNSNKCYNLTCPLLPNKSKLYVLTRRVLVINGRLISQLGVDDQFRYLGYNYGFMGARESTLEDLPIQLNRVLAAPLKPQQKLTILKKYLIPRYIYLLQNPAVTLKSLNSADRLIRLAVKKALHLPKQLTNAALYTPVRQGGLGIFSFRCRIPGIMLARLENLNNLTINDSSLENVLASEYASLLKERLTTWTRTTGVTNIQVGSYWAVKLEASASGGGLWQVGVGGGCKGVIDNPPRYWNGEDFIKAIQLRFNVLPTRGGLHNRTGDVRCRAGCGRRETVCHILQACPVTHHGRVGRHDRIVKRVAEFADRGGLQTVIEPRIRDAQGALHKPDLLLLKNREIMVTDIAVHWEGPDTLAMSAEHKIARYSGPSFVEALLNKYPGYSVSVIPLIIGARGGWCAGNDIVAKFIGLSGGQIQLLISSVLKGGWLMHSSFSSMIYADQRR